MPLAFTDIGGFELPIRLPDLPHKPSAAGATSSRAPLPGGLNAPGTHVHTTDKEHRHAHI